MPTGWLTPFFPSLTLITVEVQENKGKDPKSSQREKTENLNEMTIRLMSDFRKATIEGQAHGIIFQSCQSIIDLTN